MSRTQINARWAKRKRLELINLMGGQCSKPGFTCQRRLEFHHTGPRTWVARKTSRWMRVIHYWRDWEAGILVLLCKRCHNQTKGRPDPF